METVEHHGRTTAYRVVPGDGLGPTVLYVHGSGGTHHLWANQYASTGPSHPAVALDLSGHGESIDVEENGHGSGRAESDEDASDDGIDGSTSDDGIDGMTGDDGIDGMTGDDGIDGMTGDDGVILDAYARDVEAVAGAVDADVLVGNSMGGAIVLQVVLDEQFAPAGIVLAGSGARLPVDEKLRSLLNGDIETAIDVLHGEDVLFHEVDERERRRSKETMRGVGRSIVRRDFLACHGFDVRERLEEIAVPALAVAGEYDRLTPPADHRELAEEMPQCRYRELEDAAHLAMVERPATFNATLSAFFDELA